MRFQGTLASWNDERGFGFIVPARGDEQIFVHIKAFKRRSARPVVGQVLSFEVEVGPQGKKRAVNVEPGGAARSRFIRREERPATWGWASALAIPSLLCLYVAVSMHRAVSPVWALGYIALSIITFFAYAFDKTAATRGAWRTKEDTLIVLGLLGGWPGGLLALKLLRHKSSKPSFKAKFWLAVGLNVAAFVFFNSSFGDGLRGR